MSVEPAPLFACDRCSKPLYSAEGAPGYCALCQRFQCRTCYGTGESRRCADCLGRTWHGARNAATALAVLQEASEELGTLISTPPGSAEEAARLALLDLKIASARDAAVEALEARGPHLPARIDELRRTLLLTDARITLLRDTMEDRVAPTTPASEGDTDRRFGQALFLGAAIAVVLLNVGAVAWLMSRPFDDDRTAIATPSARGAVAGGVPTAGPIGASGRATEAPTRPAELIAFDELPTDAEIGDGWLVEPRGAATTAAFPTAIDRSARLSPAAGPATLCRMVESLPAVGLGVSSEFFLESGTASAVLLQLSQAGEPLINVVRRPDGEIVGNGEVLASESRLGLLANDAWHRLSIELTESGVETRLDGGEFEATPWAATRTDPAALQIDAICFGLPADADGDLYIDDVAID